MHPFLSPAACPVAARPEGRAVPPHVPREQVATVSAPPRTTRTMQLSRFLQSDDLLASLKGMEPGRLRETMLARTRQWYDAHPGEHDLVRANMQRFGLDSSERAVDAVIEHVALHYFEKLVPLCMGTGDFREFLDARVDAADAAAAIAAARKNGKGVLVASGHFGAVEFVVPALATHNLPIAAALRFKTEEFSRSAHAHARAFAESGLFSPISFIEVGRPGTHAALDMAAALRRKDVLLSVFDEKTDYSVEVSLFGRKVWGGAGLDKLMAFAGADAAAFAAFMIRDAGEGYRLSLSELETGPAGFVRQMYAHLERVARAHPEQWYFLHEDIPFVEQA
ncbi:MAG: hypothetical protein GF418_05615 [Chitinivibrionales bacterium]|nr:hypothetical protein [Chitinivibrionales bacterium]MBD3395088.1 hypothetical protein [Chitinivibrionales bacterium]